MTRTRKVNCSACPTRENIHDMFGAGGKMYCFNCKKRLEKWDQWPPDENSVKDTSPSPKGSITD